MELNEQEQVINGYTVLPRYVEYFDSMSNKPN